jgi:ATP-dependent exoDNAse (exonuclease V) beta subunit
MTVHSAKGLEFPVVFVAAIQKGVDTDLPVLAFSRVHGIGARWKNPATREEKDDLFQHAIRNERKEREGRESDRLFYVAMTRAEQHLVLSYSFGGKKPSNWAAIVNAKLAIDPETPRDERLEFETPEGNPWTLSLKITAEPPAALPRPQLDDVDVGQAVPPAQLQAPACPGQQDANTTATALSVFATCPRKYYLGAYLKMEGRIHKPDQNGSALPANELGIQVHALLANEPVAEPDPEALRLANVFRQSPLGRKSAASKRIEREFGFLMSLEDLVISGQIDLWFEDNGDLVIVDYKTDAVNGQEAHQRAQEYALQLQLYAMALERAIRRPPTRACLHFLKPNTIIDVDLRPSLLESPEQLVRDFQQAQETLTFPIHEGPHCKRCEFYKDLCPAGM